jgi:hypothetical protein
MTIYTFEQVKLRGVRYWKDEQGKRHQETKTFMQTINPFNKTSDGTPKGYAKIMEELRAEREAWLGEKP